MAFVNKFNAEEAQQELHKRYNLHFVDVLIKNGAKVYLFGGALRDMVMGKDWKDADIRVWIPLPPKERDAKAEALLKEANIKIKSITPFGEDFTVFRFLPEGSASNVGIDLSVVSDQWRIGPDFTINGLYFDLETSELIDQFNAVEHIENKVLRTAKEPMMQFTEEPYMIFRAVKAACQFDLAIDEETYAAMKELAPATEKTLGLVADNAMPAFTEWFLGNIFRGLNYDPQMFLRLWNDTGLTNILMEFIAARLRLSAGSRVFSLVVFEEGKKCGFEETINIFLSSIARELDPEHPNEIFGKIIRLLLITAPKKYDDFVIDNQKIHYI
jgi:tRNA nucleotidyltransferase/poly(A) polymerase